MIDVSVITINYNNREGLRKTIQSFIAQNVNSCCEYIVVDGGSDDGSQVVIDQFTEHINKKLIEPDTGIFNAMNKGVKLAKGKYCYFLNSGDIFESESTLQEVLKENHFGASPILSGEVSATRLGTRLGVADPHPWIVHQSAFVKTELLVQYPFDEELKIFGDLDLWTRLRADGKYEPDYIDVNICTMEMDGVGSHPKYIFQRLRDKIRFTRKHGGYMNFSVSAFIAIVGYCYYRIRGEINYFRYYNSYITKLKSYLIGKK